MLRTPEIHWTLDLAELHPIGEGAEQTCYDWKDGLVVKTTHCPFDTELLIENTAWCGAEGLGPQMLGIAYDDEANPVGVIVEKCEVIEPLVDALCDALYDYRNTLTCTRAVEEVENRIEEITDDLFQDVIELCWEYESQEVKHYCERIIAFFDAAATLSDDLKDMHVYNVGISPSRGYVCIDTAGYCRGAGF